MLCFVLFCFFLAYLESKYGEKNSYHKQQPSQLVISYSLLKLLLFKLLLLVVTKVSRFFCFCFCLCIQAFSSATDLESAETDGKWAEEESDISSVDEFDSVSIKGRRKEFMDRKAALLNQRVSQNGVEDGDSPDFENKDSIEGTDKKTQSVKKNGIPSAKGVKKGKIRFKDQEGKTPDNQKKSKDKRKIARKGQEDEEATKDDAGDTSAPKEEKRNKYLDEWLGIKREEVDTRYQPGKPPPNRYMLV